MKSLIRETWQVIRVNLKNVLVFELIFRFVSEPLYIRLAEKGLQKTLRAAGYSYLTAGNIGYFLLKPWTIFYILLMTAVGLLLIGMEIGALITAFAGASYSRKVTPFEMFAGGAGKLYDELARRNWRLFLIGFMDYGLTHLYLIYRVAGHIKPLNYIMTDLFGKGHFRLILTLVAAVCLAGALITVFVFHGCMIEQKNFRDSLIRSLCLIKGRWLQTLGLLLFYNLLTVAAMTAVYLIGVAAAAVFALKFVKADLALAALISASGRIELTLIFFVSIVLLIVNVAAVTVQYRQSRSRLNREPRWNFDFPARGRWNRKMVSGLIAGVGALSLFFIYDLVANGSQITDELLTPIQITAHRGSSRTAPENTMAAVRAAVDDMADYVELDVQETLDGRLVLCHDSNLQRVAGIDRIVSSMTLEELERLDVGSWFSEEFAGETIPKLEDVMDYSKGKLNLNIELKYLGRDSALPVKVVELIQEKDMEEQCVVSSVSLSYLKRVREIDPDIRTGYILSAAYGDYYSNEWTDFISLRSSFVTRRLVEAAHEAGKEIHAWTVNGKGELERMKLLSVDNVITDRPVFAREILYQGDTAETLFGYIRQVIR